MSDTVVQILSPNPADDRETTEKFYQWLEDVHTPDVFAFKGISRFLNCRRVEASRSFHPSESEYPEYISINQFFNKEAMAEFPYSPEIQYASKDALDTWGDTTGRKKIWLAAYQETKRYQRELKPDGKRMIQIVSGAPPADPKLAERFYKWLDEEHVAHTFEEFKGLVRATNYRFYPTELPFQPVVTKYPECITIFEFNNRAAYEFQMESLKGRGPASNEWGTEVGFTKNWLVEYEILKEWNREKDGYPAGK